MLRPLDSHKPASCVTFVPEQRTDILRQLNGMKFDESDRLVNNYKNIDWFEFDAVSVYEREGAIVGFSSMVQRKQYFAPDEVRILNRYYESPEMRRTSKVIGDDHVCEMVMQQLEIAREVGYNKAFISRCRSPRHLKKLIMSIGEKTNTKWQMTSEKVAVCDPKFSECWQWKAWTELC